MLQEYLATIGLTTDSMTADQGFLNAFVDEAFSRTPDDFSEEDIQALYVYDIPRLSPDGTCSILEERSDTPYNLATTFGLDFSFLTLKKHPHTLRLWRLRKTVEQLFRLMDVDWLGVYRKLDKSDGEVVLVKEAYLGVISRPEFPLTQAFAEHSNNSTVGLTGRAVVIQDVQAYAGPYYNCDSKVKSEFCVPIIDPNNVIIGIIDAESFKVNHFSADHLLQMSKVAMDLGIRRLGVAC